MQADITDDGSTKALTDRIAATMPPLRGVVHAAAVVEDALLDDITPELLRTVLAPKIAGAVNLHLHTISASLDFFIFCSSIAASLPQPAHGPYSAANSFLDAFATCRRAAGLPATSIQWGMWLETGLAKAAGARRSNADYTDRGVCPLDPEAALAVFRVALNSRVPILFAAPVNWSKFSQLWPGHPRLFSALVGTENAVSADSSGTLRFFNKEAVQEHVRQQVATVLKMSPVSIDARKPLGMLGLDSLLGLEVIRRLSSSTGVKIPATAVFNHPTVAALAAELGRRLGVETETAAPPVNGVPPVARINVSGLSEDEALLALMAGSGSNS